MEGIKIDIRNWYLRDSSNGNTSCSKQNQQSINHGIEKYIYFIFVSSKVCGNSAMSWIPTSEIWNQVVWEYSFSKIKIENNKIIKALLIHSEFPRKNIWDTNV